jgi:hypothetical protein
MCSAWTYGTGLELNSPRFSQPGDFFTYVIFVALVILVSPSTSLTLCLIFYCTYSFHPTHLEYLPAQSLLAEAVPEERKITPAAHIHIIRKSVKVFVCGVGMVGAQLRKACAKFIFAVSGCGFLQVYYSGFVLFLPQFPLDSLREDGGIGGLVLTINYRQLRGSYSKISYSPLR